MSRTKAGIQGVETVLRNLNRELEKVKGLSMKGLIKGAAIIRRDADKTPPKIPVDLGNLRASSFIVTGTGVRYDSPLFKGKDAANFNSRHSAIIGQESGVVAGKLMVAIGFSVKYAALVEGDLVTKRRRPGSGGGFFKGAIERNKSKVIEMIQKEAKIR